MKTNLSESILNNLKDPTKEIKIICESKKDDAIWKIIDKYEAGDMTKEEVKKEVEKLNNGNKDEIEADLALILKESEEDIHRVKDCLDDVDLIGALEGDTLKIEDQFDWDRVKELVKDLSSSQGFYGRLLRQMNEYEEEVGRDGMEFPIYM